MAIEKTDWISKEKRELFAKAVNSMLMTNPEVKLETALEASKKIVDTAFENYPDKYEAEEKNDTIAIEEVPF